MTKPAATESPPKTQTPTPEPPKPDKVLTFTKASEGKWKLVMSGPIKRADINHLKRFIQIEYLRTKRIERKAQVARERKDKLNATGS